MQKIIKVIQLPNGRYIKDWEYSQGYESHTETDVCWKAYDFNLVPTGIDLARKLYHYAEFKTFKITVEEL